MQIEILKSKIHRVKVTGADLNYMGSITIDEELMDAANIIAGEKEEASKHLDIALSINPLAEETHFFKAYSKYMNEEYHDALELLNHCLAANDKNIPAHYVKSLCLLQLGQYDEVIAYFDQIPKSIVVHGEKTGAIGLVYVLKNDLEKIAWIDKRRYKNDRLPTTN